MHLPGSTSQVFILFIIKGSFEEDPAEFTIRTVYKSLNREHLPCSGQVSRTLET